MSVETLETYELGLAEALEEMMKSEPAEVEEPTVTTTPMGAGQIAWYVAYSTAE
ncbi:hypothetical protein V1639_13270 [Pseudarthrobacter sp. J75]|uniref:hypothetical protein n=1 Tax=unclassified Pseudarthrobacter TaxID=2647000 RepID=UPI002E7FFCF8|nr:MULTISPECIES: hypothetical protein [unclassified Pseudarthrobacter]MEE2524706.1 hypothetical protein [Pseudarthrobacter sp. J47]MEE2529990.1 hypothetical protein [Pseudarthrobacter sp. J75]MEE2570600.1 hypothetical protein [Pseudarthrobacter sp. J64]